MVNEELISQVLKPNRDKIFMATKFGVRIPDNKGNSFTSSGIYVDYSVKHIKKAVGNSLKRLKLII